jgi:hypothetical protein
LLCEVFKSLSVHDKQQYVQRTCLRFRAVLRHPSFVDTWGCINVKLLPDTDTSPQSISRLISWLLDRMPGAGAYFIASGVQTSASPSRLQTSCAKDMGCTCTAWHA